MSLPFSRVGLRLAACLAIIGCLVLSTITAFCGILFSCGCTLWEGIRHCNVFHAQTPHCPWCSNGLAFFWLLFALIAGLTSITASLTLIWIESSLWTGLLAGLFGYLFWGSLAALLSALYFDYPFFYGATL